MAKRSWPFGVTSWDDTVKFAQLLFGVDVAFENYAERFPHRSNKSFLLFAKGACAEGRPFFEIGDFIAPQLEEIQRWEQNVRNNNARPTKSQQMLNADGWTVYYWSAQVTRAPCLCRTSFGADAHQKHVPTSIMDGRPLNNQLYIIEESGKGKRGRICPVVVCPFETLTNYVAAVSLRCNFDNQSLVYLPPASTLPLEWLPNIGAKPELAWMARKTGDLEPKWLVAPQKPEPLEVSADSTWLESLLQELEQETQGAFQDAHNQGFYINEYTTKVHALGDKLMQGLQRIAQKIHASEADGSVEKLTTRQRNKERVKMVLKKLVHLMNSLQVKSGSELVFPMLFDHMSFATHRCWETNLKVAYAKTLSAWQDHFKGSLKALHEKASVSQSIGFLLPSLQSGRAKELPVGWLIQPKPHDKTLSANAAATMEQVEQETGEDHGYIYISPGGQRFTSLQQALQYAQNDKLRNRTAADMKAVQIDSFDHNSNIHVQFTSNHEDYMHRGEHPIMQAGS